MMKLTKADLYKVSERIGRALRDADRQPLGYLAALELLSDLEDELSNMANRLTESERPELPTIKLVCAWCQLTLRDGATPATHGICKPCQSKFEGKESA